MAFLMECCNKGCCKLNQPYIDPDTDIVYCSECNQEISNVSSFTKRQMKSIKQVKQKEKKSFAIKCNKCNKTDRPKVINDEIVCALCSKVIDDISPFFKTMLKTQLAGIKEK